MKLENLSRFIQDYNPVLSEFLDKNSMMFDHNVISKILQKVKPLSEGGKRVRPYLSYLMSSEQDLFKYIDVYLSLELIHLFALIHDDIMDECDTRRGTETIHAFAKKLSMDISDDRKNHMADSYAILVGDLVFSLAEKSFVNSSLKIQNQHKFLQAYDLFCGLKEEVIYGQMLDIYLSTQNQVTDKEVYDKTFYKTASYTVIKPMQIGVVLGDRLDLLDFCGDFGREMGLGFQIQDDYFNLMLPIEITGKPQFTDILENQKTVFTQFLQNHQDNSYFQEVSKFVGLKNFSTEQESHLQEILTKSGAIQHGLQLYNQHYEQAQKILNIQKSNLSNHSYQGLEELLKYLINRQN